MLLAGLGGFAVLEDGFQVAYLGMGLLGCIGGPALGFLGVLIIKSGKNRIANQNRINKLNDKKRADIRSKARQITVGE